jgi:diaminopimelate epimerase
MNVNQVPFTKMHGIGNDFVVLDPDVARRNLAWPELARAMCDRRFGIGSDGILVVEPGRETDYRMRMFNPDGSEAEMCGNGIRCFARFVHDRGLSSKTKLSIATGAGVQHVRMILHDGEVDGVEVNMGPPEFRAEQIPVIANTPEVVDRPLTVDGTNIKVNCVSMGNPHAVAFVDDLDAFPLEHVGPLVEHHPWFPRRINFEICQVIDREHMVMRVWERGAGITLACGTGACASMAVAHRHQLVDSSVDIRLPGGHLRLDWSGSGPLMMTGPAAFVYDGLWPL